MLLCSSGISRTGVFLILDAMLDQAKAEDQVDIWNFACGMRDKRMKMIQTSVNYKSSYFRSFVQVLSIVLLNSTYKN